MSEIDELRKEIGRLADEVRRLREDRPISSYYPRVMPQPSPQPQFVPTNPWYDQEPWRMPLGPSWHS